MTQSGSPGNCNSVEGASSTSPASAVKGASATSPATAAVAPAAQVTPTRAVSSGSLPFTGLDIGLIVALAAGLLGLGYALRRTTAAPQDI